MRSRLLPAARHTKGHKSPKSGYGFLVSYFVHVEHPKYPFIIDLTSDKLGISWTLEVTTLSGCSDMKNPCRCPEIVSADHQKAFSRKNSEDRRKGRRGERNAPHSEWAPSAIVQSLHSLWHPAEISGMEATHGNAGRRTGNEGSRRKTDPYIHRQQMLPQLP